ncbi:hypothetical protein E0H53_09540 [Rhizobium leguminosarum bv. viciae]|uniref:hypothetical protein n=1 Tax=Rhizobium leguminosarum TaxID=384 RepID=UPI00103B5F19|nr:hypothetical protein [Rhizobium leguminosarum]TBZ90005.1 hypothetical protein E0H53_09540 [Rhizobium leguminosarum bv. viciae]
MTTVNGLGYFATGCPMRMVGRKIAGSPLTRCQLSGQHAGAMATFLIETFIAQAEQEKET